jgi:hypothetical protein
LTKENQLIYNKTMPNRRQQMKITTKIISIPPYISTSWDKIAALHTEHELLVITLNNATRIEIPHLENAIIQTLFATHAAYLEQTLTSSPSIKPSLSKIEELFTTPLKIMFGTMESAAEALQHNPAQSDLPPIPSEISEKIALLSKSISPEAIVGMPDAVPGCTCMYCQMARIIKGETEKMAPPIEKLEESISDEELRFEEWEVSSVGEKMYLVTSKLDPNEQYTVFLGNPIGCTCGKPHCEHIVAVLRH